jgi:rare lipoprotein A
MTCALPHRRFDGLYRVTNLENGRSVIVRHNDLGPGQKPRRRGVIIDLSRGAFERIGETRSGILRVKVEALK